MNNIYRHKYKGTKYEDLAGLFTTILYGKSSQYNRIRIDQQCLYKHIGETKGYGTLHLTTETFQAMVDYLRSRSIVVGNNFGDGPVWSMRIIRTVGSLLGFDSDELLKHSFRRSIYFVPLSNNTKQYLCGEDKTLDKNCLSVKQLTQIWKERWFFQRKQRYKTLEDVKWFVPDNFDI